jgi:hypothetical protein
VACEYSGRVRDAFKKMGHYSLSCDLLETDIKGKHYQGDIFDILYDGWDMLIGFPPCTDLCVSGAKHFAEKQKDGRQQASIKFFLDLANAPIKMKCIENPIGIMSKLYRKPDQIIQPWMFGHPEQKSTCLWLTGLPLLKETNNVYDDMMKLPKNERERIHYLPPSKDRWKERSKTYQGIANAMAEQWGILTKPYHNDNYLF